MYVTMMRPGLFFQREGPRSGFRIHRIHVGLRMHRIHIDVFDMHALVNKQQISPYFDPTYTRTGWIGQPPVLDRHEVVTIDGDVDTLRQATP